MKSQSQATLIEPLKGFLLFIFFIYFIFLLF